MSNDKKKEYYIGLDIGTTSVGWAVTDTQYNLCKFKKKSMWGVRLFEEAETAETRRLKRSARRRLERKKQRIDLLQEIFAEEIAKVDETFFLRLNESKLHLEDKTNTSAEYIHPLFVEGDKEKEFYKNFPTMFHLRRLLATKGDMNLSDTEKTKKQKELYQEIKNDPRYLYLAIHHIVKTRGHFLTNGSLEASTDILTALDELMNAMADVFTSIGFDSLSEEDRKSICEIISQRGKKKEKQDKLKEYFIYEENRNYSDSDDSKVIKNSMNEVHKLLAGMKGDFIKLLDLEEGSLDKEEKSLELSDEKFEDLRNKITDIDSDKIPFLDAVKRLHDCGAVVAIIGKHRYLSEAKVTSYEEHQNNLLDLKMIFKKYLSQEDYFNFFRKADEKVANYVSYVGGTIQKDEKSSVKKCSMEDFYKTLKGYVDQIDLDALDECDLEHIEHIKEKIEIQDLLPLQRSTENGIIPHQLHEQELNTILENAKEIFPFLDKKDETGKINIEKIQAIFKFRIPYYVGPLSTRHKDEGANVWIVRKKEGKITPWNFEKLVDEDESSVNFIARMTNKCTCLLGEDVIAKNSLLYSRYMVLNELNNLKIRGNAVKVKDKQEIFEKLFKTKNKVTGADLLRFLKKEDQALTKEDLTGFDKDFKTSLKSYREFSRILGEEMIDSVKGQEIAEHCIKMITIYSCDAQRLKKLFEKEYSDILSEKQINDIANLRYRDWGKFSKKFLCGIEGHEESTGASYKSIIEALWETNNNLMELLSQRFTFMENVSKCNLQATIDKDNQSIKERINELVTSPANKRAILQTIKIVEEIIRVMDNNPKRIFIEMARGGGEKGKRTKSRKDQLLDLYKDIKSDLREYISEYELDELKKGIKDRDERDLRSKKLFLYYTQLGKSMYTGDPINLGDLLLGKNWDRDHILPQSKIKDDSLDNLVLVENYLNREKSNEPLSKSIRDKMSSFWKALKSKGLISQTKLDGLMKSEFTDEDFGGFINRQLVETRQSGKVVAHFFEELYKDEDAEVVYVKAENVSDFRKETLKRLKSRLLNDYHHAKDAYLNIVVGNVYNAKFTSNPYKWIKENGKDGQNNKLYNIKTLFDKDLYRNKDELVWERLVGEKDNKTSAMLDRIRKIVDQNDILYTEQTYIEKGGLFNETTQVKGGKNLIPLKKGLDPEKYGGYNSAKTSYFTMIGFDGKKKDKRVVNIVEVPTYIANQMKYNKNAVVEYFENTQGLKNVKTIKGFEVIKKRSLIVINGYPLRIQGASGVNILLKNNLQLMLGPKDSETVRKIEKILQKCPDKNKLVINEEYDKITRSELNELYSTLLNKLKTVYLYRPSNPKEKIEEGIETFKNLEIENKVKLLEKLMSLFSSRATTSADLTLVGGSTNAGNIAINKNTIGKSNLTFINQSVTGLFETRKVYEGQS